MEQHHVFVSKLGDSLQELHDIWDDIGIVDGQRTERINAVFYHLHDLLKEMLNEEKAMQSRMLKRVDTYGEELLKLSSELNVPKFEVGENL